MSRTRGARVASFRGDGTRYRVYEESSAAEEGSTAEIDGKEISVTFDDTHEIVDEEVGVSGTIGARAATFRGDGARHRVYEGSSAAEEGSTAEIDGEEVSVAFFDETNEIGDEEVGVFEVDGAAKERLTAEIDGKEVEVSVKFDKLKSNLERVPVATADTVKKAAAGAVGSEETNINKLNIVHSEKSVLMCSFACEGKVRFFGDDIAISKYLPFFLM